MHIYYSYFLFNKFSLDNSTVELFKSKAKNNSTGQFFEPSGVIFVYAIFYVPGVIAVFSPKGQTERTIIKSSITFFYLLNLRGSVGESGNDSLDIITFFHRYDVYLILFVNPDKEVLSIVVVDT